MLRRTLMPPLLFKRLRKLPKDMRARVDYARLSRRRAAQ